MAGCCLEVDMVVGKHISPRRSQILLSRWAYPHYFSPCLIFLICSAFHTIVKIQPLKDDLMKSEMRRFLFSMILEPRTQPGGHRRNYFKSSITDILINFRLL